MNEDEKYIEFALKNLRQAYVKVAPSPIHGVGLFAIRDIPKGTDIMHFDYKNCPCIHIKKKVLKDKIPKEVYSQLIKNWAQTKDTVLVPLDFRNQLHFTNFLNHSENPNIRFDNGRYLSIRKIQKDEEILISMTAQDYNPEGVYFKDLSKKQT
jgi:SET domain-containing protein